MPGSIGGRHAIQADAPTHLVNVVVSDPIAPDCDADIGGLEVGQSVTYSCGLGPLYDDVTNTAYVTGHDELQNRVTDNDSASVTVLRYS